MRLPFVSRALLDESERWHVLQVQFLKEELERAHADLVVERDRFNRLASDLLKPAVPPNYVAPERKEPSPISRIIREQSSTGDRVDPALSAHLHRYAKQLKAEGLSEDEIVGKLVEWQTSEMIGQES